MTRRTDRPERLDEDGEGEQRRSRVTRRPQPRHITLGGHEAVALTPKEYEQLIASRRQIGGQSARVRVLAQQVKRSEQLLRDLEDLITAADQGCGEPARTPPAACSALCADPDATAGTESGCLRCAIAALLRRHREAAA
jgi:hypothetical protein